MIKKDAVEKNTDKEKFTLRKDWASFLEHQKNLAKKNVERYKKVLSENRSKNGGPVKDLDRFMASMQELVNEVSSTIMSSSKEDYKFVPGLLKLLDSINDSMLSAINAKTYIITQLQEDKYKVRNFINHLKWFDKFYDPSDSYRYMFAKRGEIPENIRRIQVKIKEITGMSLFKEVAKLQ